jgi:hypothetical protein
MPHDQHLEHAFIGEVRCVEAQAGGNRACMTRHANSRSRNSERTWTRGGVAVAPEVARDALLGCALNDIWFVQRPANRDLDEIPLIRADAFGAPVVIGPVVAARPASLVADNREPAFQDQCAIGDVEPGYVAIRHGDGYVVRLEARAPSTTSPPRRPRKRPGGSSSTSTRSSASGSSGSHAHRQGSAALALFSTP